MNISWMGIMVLFFLVLMILKGFREGFIKEIISLVLIVVTFILIAFINPHINQFIKENTPISTYVERSVATYVGDGLGLVHTKEEQSDFIDGLTVPELIKNAVKENNTAQGYLEYQVGNFYDYIIEFMSGIIVDGVSFLVTFILVKLLIKITLTLIEMIVSLPGIKQTNKMAGAILGFVKGICVIWVLMILITVLYNTEVGEYCLKMIESDVVLYKIYEYNIALKWFMKIF